MEIAHGTYRAGQVELDYAVHWPEGARVAVTPVTQGYGLAESDWPTTREGIDQLLASLAEMEPLELTPADESEIAGSNR
jgi:hypothetical protein